MFDTNLTERSEGGDARLPPDTALLTGCIEALSLESKPLAETLPHLVESTRLLILGGIVTSDQCASKLRESYIEDIARLLPMLKANGLTHIGIFAEPKAQARLNSISAENISAMNEERSRLGCSDKEYMLIVMSKLIKLDVLLLGAKSKDFELDDFNRATEVAKNLIGALDKNARIMILGSGLDCGQVSSETSSANALLPLAHSLREGLNERVISVRLVERDDVIQRALDAIPESPSRLIPGKSYIAPNEYPLSASCGADPFALSADYVAFRTASPARVEVLLE